jgi:predicted alpha/beta hydrolase
MPEAVLACWGVGAGLPPHTRTSCMTNPERSVFIPALDGYRLAATLFPPTAPDNGIVVQINGATGVRREYYHEYARFLAGRGFHVVTYNYRGIGDSGDIGWHGGEPTLLDWGEKDLAGVIDWIAREFPRHRLVCVGHSGGGQWLGLARNNGRVQAQLAIASQSGYWGHFRPRDWPRLLFIWYLLVPLATRLLGRFPGRLIGSEDLPRGVALEWARWCRNPHYISDRRGRPLREHFHGYRGRLRFYVIDDDRFFAPANAVRALAGFYANADVQILHVTPADFGVAAIGHFGFFRAGMPVPAWQQTADWLWAAAQPDALQRAG